MSEPIPDSFEYASVIASGAQLGTPKPKGALMGTGVGCEPSGLTVSVEFPQGPSTRIFCPSEDQSGAEPFAISVSPVPLAFTTRTFTSWL
jgi:hypothetical protein